MSKRTPRRASMVLPVLIAGFFSGAMAALAQTAPPADGASRAPGALAAAKELPIAPGKSSDDAMRESDAQENTVKGGARNILRDQKGLWTSPARMKLSDATWLVPLGGLAAAFLATDSATDRHLNRNPATIQHYRSFSNYGIASMAAGGGGLYLLGLMDHNPHQRETGFLAGEAALDSLLIAEAAKYAAGRERPYVDNARGRFWQGGDSFPSEHATAAWSIAGVIAHEYPGPLPQIAAYGMAGAISAARIRGQEHFPADVVAGAALGYLVAHYVYKTRHDEELGGGPWEIPAIHPRGPEVWSAKNMGSPYVPMDSWIYPAFDRLQALGYVHGGFEGLRPWTRIECARLAEEAGDNLAADDSAPAEAQRIYESLQQEFAPEIALLGGGNNAQARLERVYTRIEGISGEPLRDGFDFGQTITNDYGRPYAEGVNNVTGAAGWFTDGPFVGYLRGEFQHAPSSPALPASAEQAIAQEEGIPTAPAPVASPAVNQWDLLEGYVGMQAGNWQITFGKQENWWGPDQAGPMLASTNAEPVEMFEINRTTPFTLPSVLAHIGPIRAEYFLGRVGGYHWLYNTRDGYLGSWTQALADQPFFEGEKFSVKPTPNLDFGFSMTILFSGQGMPFTLHKFGQILFPITYGAPYESPDHTGSRQGGFDFRYRLPGARNWLTFYGDGFTHDEPSPLWGAFDKSAFDSGLYFSRLPKLPKLDFRVEGLFTDNPNSNPVLQHGFFFWEGTYRSGFTNQGNLLGSWIGRQGQGAQAWTTYWFSPRNTLQFSFRHQKVSREFVPQGGTITDGSLRANFWLRNALSLSALLQYEKWAFPVLAPSPHSNLTASLELSFWPHPPRLGRRGSAT